MNIFPEAEARRAEASGKYLYRPRLRAIFQDISLDFQLFPNIYIELLLYRPCEHGYILATKPNTHVTVDIMHRIIKRRGLFYYDDHNYHLH